MSTTPKKPPSSGGSTGGTPSTARKAPASSNTTSTTNGSAPNRSPSRMAASSNTNASTTTTTNSASSVNRTRSVRNSTNAAGTPISARAAARKPAAGDSTSADDDARAEMQARLDELQQQLASAESALLTSQKQAEILQIKLDDSLKDQTILEENLQSHTERVEALENEKRDFVRHKREMEQTFESEREANAKEREEGLAREGEMQRSVVRLKEALSQQRSGSLAVGEEDGFERRHSRPMSISRTSSFRSGRGSPAPDGASGQFAPSSTSLQRSDSRNNSRLVMEKDRIIEGLKLDLAETQIKLVELENKGGSGLQMLEAQMYDVKMQNARLMEENESFQLLLREKTLNGDFAPSSLRAPSTAGDGSRPPSRNPDLRQSGTSLADELALESDEPATPAADGDAMAPDSAVSAPDGKEKRLQSEVNNLKEQNKALTLYINNIISRLLQHEQFEQILDKSPDLMAGPGAASQKYANMAAASAGGPDIEKDLPPPPPPSKDMPPPGQDGEVQQGQGLLARAGSVLRGRATRPTRPMSQMLSADQAPRVDDAPTVHENPSTAPRIPLGRSGSTRTGGAGAGHRRANSDWQGAAASVVTNMYKGPAPSLQDPTSPGLGSPTRGARSVAAGSFFPRVPSGNTVPTTIDEMDRAQNENAPPVPPHKDSRALASSDSAGIRSNRNSVISNPPDHTGAILTADPAAMAALTGTTSGDVSSNPSSPPRSTTSSGERDVRPGGAVMMGSKPRPLRLVQEASAAADESKKAGAGANANRGSWFGWMNKGGAAAAAAAGGFMQGRSISGGDQQQQQQP